MAEQTDASRLVLDARATGVQGKAEFGHNQTFTMRIGPRYLHKSLSFPDPSAEKDALLTSLEGAPGLVSVYGVELHHKGGHRASLEVDQGLLNGFVSHMDAQGWMDAL